MIPISMFGHDVKSNIIMLTVWDHNKTHQVLNINYNKIRNFRRKHNHKMRVDVEFIKDLRKLHLMYFKDLEKLPHRIVVKHCESMKLMCYRLNGQHNLGANFGNTDHLNHIVKFNYFLKWYHLLLTKLSMK